MLAGSVPGLNGWGTAIHPSAQVLQANSNQHLNREFPVVTFEARVNTTCLCDRIFIPVCTGMLYACRLGTWTEWVGYSYPLISSGITSKFKPAFELGVPRSHF